MPPLSPFPAAPPLVRAGVLTAGLALCGCTQGTDGKTADATTLDGTGTDETTQVAPTCGPCCHTPDVCDSGSETGDTGTTVR